MGAGRERHEDLKVNLCKEFEAGQVLELRLILQGLADIFLIADQAKFRNRTGSALVKPMGFGSRG